MNKSYGGADKVKKMKLQSFRRQDELLSVAYEESIGDCYNRIQVLLNSMKACDEMFSGQQLIEKFLRTFDSQFDTSEIKGS